MPRRTKLIIAGAVAIIIVLAVSLVLLYVNVWSVPTKQDFERAKADVGKLESRYNDLSTRLQIYSGSIKDTKPGESSDAKTKYDKAMNAVNASFRTLDESRTMRDADVRPAYNALVKKQRVVQSYADGFIMYRKSFAVCIDVFDVTRSATGGKAIASAHKKAAADCLPLLYNLKRSRTPYFADYAKNYASAIRKRQAVFDNYAAGKLSDSQAGNQITDIAHTDLKRVIGSDDGLIKARQNASAASELQRLKQVLDQKIKQS